MPEDTSLEQVCSKLRRQMPALAERYGVVTLGIFGSVSRRESDSESDLDILVTFDDPPGLMAFLELEEHLGTLTERPVDLVMESALKPRIRHRILDEIIPV
ncbi:MAG: nucleotidyltransferase family protein [Acidobacteriota bacterium]